MSDVFSTPLPCGGGCFAFSNAHAMQLPILTIGKRFNLPRPVGSSDAVLLAQLAEREKKAGKLTAIVTSDAADAQRLMDELVFFSPGLRCVMFPDWETLPYDTFSPHQDLISERLATLWRIKQRNHAESADVVLVPATTALYRLAPPSFLAGYTFEFKVKQKLDEAQLKAQLTLAGYSHVSQVVSPGEYAVRGGLIDLFPMGSLVPYRVDLFDDEIDSIRSFDVETQLSIEKLKKISIIPNVENKLLQENRESFLDYINEKTVLILQNTELLGQQLDKLFDKANEAFDKLSKDIQHAPPEDLFLNQKQFLRRALDFSVIELHANAVFKIDKKVEFHIQPQPSFNKQFDLLLNNLSENHFNGYKNYLSCSNENQASRFHDIFEDIDEANHESIRKQYKTMVLPLFEGFIDEENQIACYTDPQIFERYHKFSIKNGYSKKQTITLKELTSLSVGDYVTHIDHGIGKFGGLQKIQVEGKTQEAIKLVYKTIQDWQL
jgi:transcription-repair coupling factor (superfamily II helicase)